MTATQLIELLLGGPTSSEAPTRSQSSFSGAAQQIVRILLAQEPVAESRLVEASVHLPKRGTVWVATFTGAGGGQEWRTTGLTDRNQALLVAKDWEAKAREQRARMGHTPRKPILRIRRSASSTEISGLSQRETALLMGISERAVREIEHRAIEKLRRHPLLREIWQKHLSGELDEHQPTLSQDEVEALFNLARTPEEQRLVCKVLALIHA
jgi:DNA-binding CsgD family transcriptional regulator